MTEQVNATATTTQAPPAPVSSSRCNECSYCNNAGHVGTPTAAEELKLRWRAQRGKNESLKQFARALIAKKDQMAIDWMDHKNGSLNESRNEKNNARISLERQASKAARRKKKAGGKQETAAAAPAAK